MKPHIRILAGAIVGLLVAATPLAALPLPDGFASEPTGVSMRDTQSLTAPVIVAQAEPPSPEEATAQEKKTGERRLSVPGSRGETGAGA